MNGIDFIEKYIKHIKVPKFKPLLYWIVVLNNKKKAIIVILSGPNIKEENIIKTNINVRSNFCFVYIREIIMKIKGCQILDIKELLIALDEYAINLKYI
jgi:hypothetical protein